MKNVLFYYDNFCGFGSHGGTEVATARIAEALAASGSCRVFNAFLRGKPSADHSPYSAVIRLNKSSRAFERALAAFIADYEIDVVVNMGRFFRQQRLRDAISLSGRNVKLLFMHHFAPGSEKIKPTYRSGFRLLRLDPANPLYWLRASVYPLVKLPRTLRWKGIYRKVHDISDGVVVLSKGYIPEYMRLAGIEGAPTQRFHAIPNIFNPDDAPSPEAKEKRVLILSRMDEIQKRISLALEIWKRIETDPELADWHLDIVGSGHDFKALRKRAKALGLKRVVFHGWRDGREFLSKNAVLMSTSLYEGLSLSMIEAQSLGCVPIAFDSYSSLADIVTDGVSAVVVEGFGNVEAFADKLSALLKNDDLRQSMARQGRLAAARFSPAAVAGQWLSLLSSLL